MQIKEIISEAINLAQHQRPLRQVILDSIVRSLKGLTSSQFEKYRVAVDRNGALHILGKQVYQQLKTKIKPALEDRISSYVNSNINPVPKKFTVSVSFDDTGNTGAFVDDLDMILDETALDTISRKTVDYLEDTAISEQASDGQLFQEFFDLIQDTTADELGYQLDGELKRLTYTIVHEMVHVIQHLQQFRAGRFDLEYRSYLDPRKQQFPGDQYISSPEYKKLYFASPQEIAAFSNEIALRIIDDYSDDGDFSLDPKKLSKVIPRYLQLIKNPKTDLERKVYKRYAKLIYQEITRYLDRSKQQ
jgi:hypothetical protein